MSQIFKKIIVFALILLLAAILYFSINSLGGGTRVLSVPTFMIGTMKVEILQEGTGDQQVKNGDSLIVKYAVSLPDGTKIDSSYDRDVVFNFTVGQGEVLEGWDLGLIGMKIGEKRRLTIPPELAYGQAGFAAIGIPGDSTFISEIELTEIR